MSFQIIPVFFMIFYLFICPVTVIHLKPLKEKYILMVECYIWIICDLLLLRKVEYASSDLGTNANKEFFCLLFS